MSDIGHQAEVDRCYRELNLMFTGLTQHEKMKVVQEIIDRIDNGGDVSELGVLTIVSKVSLANGRKEN